MIKKRLIFSGEFFNGEYWDGFGYDTHDNIVFEIKNGNGFIKLYNMRDKLKVNRVKDLSTQFKIVGITAGLIWTSGIIYKGLATGDKTFFEEAIADFEKTGDFFYISLPKMALKWYNEGIHKGGEMIEIKGH